MIDQAAAAVIAALIDRSETVASAESLTGGLVGELLTDIPGSSACYLGGVITYATPMKTTLAGVDPATLNRWGPVAELTALEMAQGVAERCGADWGLATTGVAGPEPLDGHPVGQVFVAAVRRGQDAGHVRELRLEGDRSAVRRQSADGVLRLLTELLGVQNARS